MVSYLVEDSDQNGSDLLKVLELYIRLTLLAVMREKLVELLVLLNPLFSRSWIIK